MENKIRDIIDQNRSYKTDFKHISAKHEKVISEVKTVKSDKENQVNEIKKTLSFSKICEKRV